MSDVTHSRAQVAVRAQRHIYIAWIAFQRRPESMRSYVGYDLIYVPPPFKPTWAKPFGYFAQAARTVAVIVSMRPDVVWYQAPPTLLAYVIALARLVAGRQFKVVADCHNGALDANSLGAFWSRIPGVVPLLNTFNVVLAHNAVVAKSGLALGIAEDKLIVLETRPAQIEVAPDPDAGRPIEILVPCSFHKDEPIDDLLETARRLPEAKFLITGSRKRAEAQGFVSRAPANAAFTDYLTQEGYVKALRDCAIVLGLTSEEGVQLSAANEAVGAGKPLVLSDTRILRDLFGAAALFAANKPQAMADTLRQAIGQLPELAAASRLLKSARERRWRAQADECLRRLQD